MTTGTERVQLVAHLDQLAATVKGIQHHDEAHYTPEQIAALMASHGFQQAAEMLRWSVNQSPEFRLGLAEAMAARAEMAVQIGFD